jgi:hypothetical protein
MVKQGCCDMKVDACSIYLETNWNPSVWHTQAPRLLVVLLGLDFFARRDDFAPPLASC